MGQIVEDLKIINDLPTSVDQNVREILDRFAKLSLVRFEVAPIEAQRDMIQRRPSAHDMCLIFAFVSNQLGSTASSTTSMTATAATSASSSTTSSEVISRGPCDGMSGDTSHDLQGCVECMYRFVTAQGPSITAPFDYSSRCMTECPQAQKAEVLPLCKKISRLHVLNQVCNKQVEIATSDAVREGCSTDYYDNPGPMNNDHPAGPFVGVTVGEKVGVKGTYPKICDELCAERDTHLNKIADRSCVSKIQNSESEEIDVRPIGVGDSRVDSSSLGGVGEDVDVDGEDLMSEDGEDLSDKDGEDGEDGEDLI